MQSAIQSNPTPPRIVGRPGKRSARNPKSGCDSAAARVESVKARPIWAFRKPNESARVASNTGFRLLSTSTAKCPLTTESKRRLRNTGTLSRYSVAPRIQGLNSSSPIPCASLRLGVPEATAIIVSKISRPTSSTLAPSRIRPALMSISPRMR